MRHQPVYRSFRQLAGALAAALLGKCVETFVAPPLAALQRLAWGTRPGGMRGMLLAHCPYWLLALRYCHTMHGKLARIERVALRIRAWLASVRELCGRDETLGHLLDVRQEMRDELECTKRALRELRDVCLDVSRLFGEAGYNSRRLARLQDKLVGLLAESCELATQLQAALAEYDRLALARLRLASGSVAA